MHETAEPAHVVDGDLGADATGIVVERAPQVEEIGMRARIDQMPARRVGRDVERLRPAAEQAALVLARQQEPCETPRQGCLADAARTGQQPGVMQPAALLCRQHRLFGLLMADQTVVAPRRRPVVGPFELLEFGRI